MNLTPWGYEADELEDILTVEQFDAATGGRWTGDERVPAQIRAAQAAMRDWCGWHIWPVTACRLEADALRGRRLLQLPATHVASVESVTVGGEPVDFKWKPNGLVRLEDRLAFDEWGAVAVEYTAGAPSADVVADLIVHRVTHALAVPAGVQSEAAGGVSITYAASWTSNNRSTNLPADNLTVLAPYRVTGVD